MLCMYVASNLHGKYLFRYYLCMFCAILATHMENTYSKVLCMFCIILATRQDLLCDVLCHAGHDTGVGLCNTKQHQAIHNSRVTKLLKKLAMN